MQQYIVSYGSGDTERIEADRVTFEPEDRLYVFYDTNGKEIGFVSLPDARSVVLASALNQPRQTQVIR